MADIAVLQEIPELPGRHPRAVVFRLLGRSAQMRDHDRALDAHDLLGRKIGHIAAHLACHERIHDILLIHQHIPGQVQDHHAVFHQADGVLVDHAFRVIQRRHMDRNIITHIVKLIYRLRMMDASGQIPGGSHRHIRVIAVHFHAQVHRRIGNLHADGAKSDHAELLALDLRPGKGFLLLLRDLGDIAVFLVFLHPVDAADDIAGSQEHSGDGQLLHAVGIGARRVEYDDPFIRAAVQRDIVYPGSGTGNRL